MYNPDMPVEQVDKKFKPEHADIITEVLDQDERRRKDPKNPFLVNEKGLNLTRVIKIGKGVYNTEWIDFCGEKVPLRLLSIEEEDRVKFETHRELKSEKSIYREMKDDPAVFERVYLCKLLSLATTPNPDSGIEPFLKEKEIRALPAGSFAGLVWHYQMLEKEYNPRIGSISEDEINFLITELFDAKKKSICMNGLNFLQMQSVLSKLLDIVKDVGANIGMLNSLEDIKAQEKSSTQIKDNL